MRNKLCGLVERWQESKTSGIVWGMVGCGGRGWGGGVASLAIFKNNNESKFEF